MVSGISAILCFLTNTFFLANVLGVPQPPQNDCYNKTIHDLIVSENLSPTLTFDNNGSNFNILANLVAASNSEGILNVSVPGGITFFAPNDDALVRTAQDLGYEGDDEYEGYRYIFSYISNRYENPIEYIFNMPLYHIVAPSMNSTEILKKTSFATWDSGLLLERNGLQLIDRNPELPDAELIPGMLDICASNGYIHVVSRVLFSGILNQTAEDPIRNDGEKPCLDHSEEPTYSPEEGEPVKVDSFPGPSIEAEVIGEVEETPAVKQSSISTLGYSSVVGPVDRTKTTIHGTNPSSDQLMPSFEVLEEESLIETPRADLLASPELTPQLSPAWSSEESVGSTPILYETTGYNLESSPPLDDVLYPSMSPVISFGISTPVSLEEYVPSPEVHDSHIEPSILPAPPITNPSSPEPLDSFEPELTALDLLTSEPSLEYVKIIPSPQEATAFNVGPVLQSPESTTVGELESLEGSASPELSKDPSFEVSTTVRPEIRGFFDIDGCFPRTATVHLPNGNDIEMHKLQAGHEVMSCESKSSTVYMFSHRQAIGMHRFVRIESMDNHTIELSPEHYIYANGRLVIAQNVKVGDMLRTLDGQSKVSRISTVNRTGLYAPHTMHGDIVVGRIVASTYTNALPYWIAHPILEVIRLPVRFGVAKEPIGSLLYNGCPRWRDMRRWLF